MDAMESLLSEICELENYPVGTPDTRWLEPDDHVLVASDAHFPYISYPLLRKMLEDIKKYEITSVIWAGDFLDLHQFSRFGVTDHHIDYQEVKRGARRIIEMTARVLGPLGHQVISLGNHDARFIKKLDNYENLRGLYQSCGLTSMIDDGELFISENPTVEAIELKHSDGSLQSQWVIQHPFKFRAPFQNPNELARVEHKNALCAHSHHFGFMPDYTGEHWVCESGGMFDPSKFTYVHQAPQNMRPMVNGYFILIEDQAPIGVTGRSLGPKAVASKAAKKVYRTR